MGEKRKMTGRCLCGAVRITAAEVPVEFGACHCGMCRKWGGGGPLFAVHCSGEIAFDGAENIVRYHSSEWAERAFCKKCGTNLFYRLVDSDEHIFSVGIFDDQSAFTFASQVPVGVVGQIDDGRCVGCGHRVHDELVVVV